MFQYTKCSIFFLCLILFNSVASWSSRKKYKNNIRHIVDLIKRRNTIDSDESIIKVPESVKDLPEAEPVHPGHTLLQPRPGTLMSAIKYHHNDLEKAVYGNLNNLGITYDKTNGRVLYTGFRKNNDLLIKLLQALAKRSNIRPKKGTNDVVIIELDPLFIKNIGNGDADYLPEMKNNDAREILDDPHASNDEYSYLQKVTRRQRKPRYSKYRDRNSEQSSDRHTASSSESESSDYENNPGNPYTVFKDKYRQNWMWNHFMDGNHMNINPYAPPLNSLGPSGVSLFFGRKWWYFNQDDFKPLN